PRCPPRTTHPQPLNGYLRSCCSEVLGRFRGVIGVRGGGWRVLVGHQGWSLICSPQRAGPMAARLSVSWVGGPVRIGPEPGRVRLLPPVPGDRFTPARSGGGAGI